MRRQLRQRFRQQANIQLAQSTICSSPQDKSIIHELGDLLDDEGPVRDSMGSNNDIIAHHNHEKIQRGYAAKLRLNALGGTNIIKNHLKPRNEHSVQTDNLIMPVAHAFSARNKLPGERSSSEQIGQLLHARSHYKTQLFDVQQRKSFNKEHSSFESKKQLSNGSQKIKLKFDYNRSNLIKCKQFLTNVVLPKCEICDQSKSQLFRKNLVCRNRKCRLLQSYQNWQTFPLIASLYQSQTPSSTCQELEDLKKKISEQLARVQIWHSQLLDLQYNIQTIIENRKQNEKYNKGQLKNFISALSAAKVKRNCQNSTDIKTILEKLQFLDLRQQYEQLKNWQKIDLQKFQSCKSLSEMLQKCQPLCLKQVISQISSEIADVSDNFNSTPAILNASEYFSYNFFGDISKIILIVDGSIQVKRENFLMIQNLQQLKLSFQSRKTCRELKQLFSILPVAESIVVTFDYKLHSHVSSQSFPIVSKSCSLATKSVQISLLNARPEVFEDIAEVSKVIKSKSNVSISVQMNTYIPESQWPDYCKSVQFGTRTVKNLIKNLQTEATKIKLELPLRVNLEQISQFILNGDYFKLIHLQLKMINSLEQNSKNSQQLSKLLQKIIIKKKLLVGHLISKKRQTSHPLNKNYSLAESVYKVLF